MSTPRTTSLDARQLRQLRLSRGWTQQHLAEIAGVSMRTIQRVEKTGTVSSETLMSLAAAMNMQPEDLSRTDEDKAWVIGPTAIIVAMLLCLIVGIVIGAGLATSWTQHVELSAVQENQKYFAEPTTARN